MRTLIHPDDVQIIAIIPDEIASMYDEDLFIQIQDFDDVYADGDYFNLTVDSVVYPILMWGGIGRLYFDDIAFDDFTKTVKEINITAPFEATFSLLPKKSIGDVGSLVENLLPFWNGRNTFTLVEAKTIFFGVEGDIVESVFAALEKYSIVDSDLYFIGEAGTPLKETKEVCDNDIYFEWIDEDGLWRSWYFKLKETKVSPKSDTFDYYKNISESLNERHVKIEQKKNMITRIFSSGYEEKSILTILNSIKSSSFVFMGLDLERVNIKSEDYSDFNDSEEFIFSVITETKTAI